MCSFTDHITSNRQTGSDRATAHDLRNLFGIVAGAARLLDQSPDHERMLSILAALNRVASRGEAICDSMLSKAPEPPATGSDNLDVAIAAAVPLVRPMLTQDVCLMLDLQAAGQAMPLSAEDVETILVELVGNAVRHGEGASRVIIRSRLAAGRAWLIVADDGRGRLEQLRALHHGHGLLRLDLLVRAAGGDLQIRRARGGGLVVGISSPLSARPGPGQLSPSQSPAREKDHENRQPVAA